MKTSVTSLQIIIVKKNPNQKAKFERSNRMNWQAEVDISHSSTEMLLNSSEIVCSVHSYFEDKKEKH